jgi:hypothetical protein
MIPFREWSWLGVGQREKNGPSPMDEEPSETQSVTAEQAHASTNSTFNEAYHYHPWINPLKTLSD